MITKDILGLVTDFSDSDDCCAPPSDQVEEFMAKMGQQMADKRSRGRRERRSERASEWFD